jgi:hypothetical protein
MDKLEKELLDSNSDTAVNYTHVDSNGDIRINSMGDIEEYREGYWQQVPWKYNTAK